MDHTFVRKELSDVTLREAEDMDHMFVRKELWGHHPCVW